MTYKIEEAGISKRKKCDNGGKVYTTKFEFNIFISHGWAKGITHLQFGPYIRIWVESTQLPYII